MMEKYRNQQIIELKEYLDLKAEEFESPNFVESDPISIPHQFKKKEDIEISAFLTATISWGNRKSIIKNAMLLMEMFDMSPHQFICSHTNSDLKPLLKFVHRTFNHIDLFYFIHALQIIYTTQNGLEYLFSKFSNNPQKNIGEFHKHFLNYNPLKRTRKHISNPYKNSAAKRINMFLRWMVRNSKKGVDFGIWKNIHPSQLCIPLDVHTSTVSRKLGLLSRKQNDWKSVIELTQNLKKIDKNDPIKYDFALFGIGINQLI